MTDLERTLTAASDPTQRRHVVRSTVRVLLLDDQDRVLLFQDSDPGIDKTWWILPGGGIDPGESELDAVVREIDEETGLALGRAAVLGPVARRHVVHGYSDQVVDQDDAFYVARVATFEVSTVGFTPDEQVTIQQHRWWSRADVLAATDEIWPANLTDLWDLAGVTKAWPVALDQVEESSVPASLGHLGAVQDR